MKLFYILGKKINRKGENISKMIWSVSSESLGGGGGG